MWPCLMIPVQPYVRGHSVTTLLVEEDSAPYHSTLLRRVGVRFYDGSGTPFTGWACSMPITLASLFLSAGIYVFSLLLGEVCKNWSRLDNTSSCRGRMIFAETWSNAIHSKIVHLLSFFTKSPFCIYRKIQN